MVSQKVRVLVAGLGDGHNVFKTIEEAAEHGERADPGATEPGFEPCLDQVQTDGLRKFI